MNVIKGWSHEEFFSPKNEISTLCECAGVFKIFEDLLMKKF
jgi:hypothetical protein